jgi:GNAT superfamily N-acetyltransferase
MSSNTLETDGIRIERIPAGYEGWEELLDLILRSFDYMTGVIDPPSSALHLTPASLREKAGGEVGFLAMGGSSLIGCVFLPERESDFYLGKFAVDPGQQGRGVGRRLFDAAELYVRGAGKPVIELQTRIELTGNHQTFQRLGFHEVGQTAHQGYDRATSVTMRKELA